MERLTWRFNTQEQGGRRDDEVRIGGTGRRPAHTVTVDSLVYQVGTDSGTVEAIQRD
jgi:hypothetical protein